MRLSAQAAVDCTSPAQTTNAIQAFVQPPATNIPLFCRQAYPISEKRTICRRAAACGATRREFCGVSKYPGSSANPLLCSTLALLIELKSRWPTTEINATGEVHRVSNEQMMIATFSKAIFRPALAQRKFLASSVGILPGDFSSTAKRRSPA